MTTDLQEVRALAFDIFATRQARSQPKSPLHLVVGDAFATVKLREADLDLREEHQTFDRVIDSAMRILNASLVNIGLIGEDGLVHLYMHPETQFPDDLMYQKTVAWLRASFPAPVRDTPHECVRDDDESEF